MTRHIASALIAYVCVCTGSLQAQQSVTIKVKESTDGDIVLYKERTTEMTRYKLFDPTGKIITDLTEKATITTDHTDTLISETESAYKLKRKYGKDITVRNEKTEIGALDGKTVLIERQKDKYSFRDENGKALMGEAADILADEFNADADALANLEKKLIPKEAVKVGEKWKLDIPRIVKAMNKQGAFTVDAVGAFGTGELRKTYSKDGMLFGIILFKMEFPLLATGKGDEKVMFNKGAKVVADTELDLCIDGMRQLGTSKEKVSITGTGSNAKMPGHLVTLESNRDMLDTWGESARKPAKKAEPRKNP